MRWLLIGLVLMSAASARADVFVIAPPYYEGIDGRAVSDEIVRVVTEDLSKQHEVVSPLKAAGLVPKEHRVSCPEGECAERYREASGAVAAIVIRVGRLGTGPGLATSFQLGIQPAPGLEYTDGALFTDGPLKDIVLRALRESFRQYRQGPGPWLEITGAPKGASVYVDDRPTGTLPTTLSVPLGTHQIRVEALTFEPGTQVVSLLSPASRAKLDFHLEPARATLVTDTKGRPLTAASTETSKENEYSRVWPNPWMRVGGGAVFLAGGLVLGGYQVSHKARAGDCRTPDPNRVGCDQENAFGGMSKGWLGLGVGLSVVGIGLVTWGILGERKKNAVQASVDVGTNRFGIGIGGAL